MRSIFTKIFALLLCFSLSEVSTAQNINTLTINSPEGIAGNYEVVRAAFGSTSNNPITANAAFGNDGTATPTFGCNALTNDLSGLIGFVDRGSCAFVQKAQRAQAAGAIALIICQNADVWPFTAGGTDPNITIPVFTLSLADCQKIRTDILSGGVNATLRFFFECENETPEYADNVIWGKNPGEGDFTGGFNGWTFDKDDLWEWNGTGQITKQTYSADVNMASFTRCDGFAEFNSDFLDNGGGGDFGSGSCPSLSPPNGTANVPPCTGEIISPNIDLSGIEVQGIIVEFSQAYRTFRNRYFISASQDGGETWSEPFEFNIGRDIYNGRERVALNGFEGASQIRIKFVHFGQYYYWAIDDVIIINNKFADLKVNDNFYSVAPQLRTPKSQVSEIPLLADIENIGNADANETVLAAVFVDQEENEIGVLQNNYGTVEAGTLVENKPFEETFTPPAEEGTYFGNYVILSEDEEPGANNVLEFFFEVTDKTYGNLLPEAEVTPANYMRDIAAIWAVSDRITNFYSGGNIFYVANGQDYTIENVRFGLENPVTEVDGSGFVVVDLFEWQDLNGDGACTPDERELVGTNSAFIDGSYPNLRSIEIPMWKADEAGEAIEDTRVELKDNTTYFVVAHTNPVFDGIPRYRFLTYNGFTNTSFNRSLYHAATNFAFDTLKIERNAGSLWQLEGTSGDFSEMRSRNFTIIGNSATLFSYAVMYLEMDVVKTSSVKNNFTNNIKASTFPNPASRDLFVDLTLENVSKNVKIDLISMDGQLVLSKNFENIQDDRLKMDVTNVPGGSYTVLINTDEGSVSRKVLVIK